MSNGRSGKTIANITTFLPVPTTNCLEKNGTTDSTAANRTALITSNSKTLVISSMGKFIALLYY
jgi:hypothetical protein